MTQFPLISVIVPIYCNAAELGETVKSICLQDYPNIELIISDDASPCFVMADVKAYVTRLASKNIKKIIIHQNDLNLGTVKHENSAVKLASGQFIKFLAPGDAFYGMDSLKKLYFFAQQQGKMVVTSETIVTDIKHQKEYYLFPSLRRGRCLNTVPVKKLFEKLVFSNIIAAEGCLFSRDFFTKAGGFDEQYRLLEDWPLWLLLARKEERIPCLLEPTALYSVGGVSSAAGTAFESKMLKQDMLLCFEKEIFPYFNQLPLWCQYFAIYQYKKMKEYEAYTKLKKVTFVIRFFPFQAYCHLKAVIKKILIKYTAFKN